MNPEVFPRYEFADGIIVPALMAPQNTLDAMAYKPKDDDVIIATYPKCGTTWMQYIVNLIIQKGKPFSGVEDFFRRSPFFEMCGQEAVENRPKPGAFKTHLPRQALKHFSDKTKYIVVVRNPKDCCVSLFHHTKMFPAYEFKNGTFDTFFELFIKGKVEYNDYFDHLNGWYEVKDKPNVLYVTFESLKANKEAAVMKVASFLGEEYVAGIHSDPEIMKNILHYSSFDFMKGQTNEFFTALMNPDEHSNVKLPSCTKQDKEKKKATFVRKGEIGDYKNLMSDEQVKRLEERFQEKCQGSPVLDLWKGI